MFGYQVADLQSDLNVAGGKGAKQVKKAPKKEPKKKD